MWVAFIGQVKRAVPGTALRDQIANASIVPPGRGTFRFRFPALRTGLLSQRPSGTDPSFEAHNPALKCWATFTASLRDGIVFGSPNSALKCWATFIASLRDKPFGIHNVRDLTLG
jgi:hypothetical protein